MIQDIYTFRVRRCPVYIYIQIKVTMLFTVSIPFSD